MNPSNFLRLPGGTRDLLPEEGRMMRRLQQNAESLFERWGYSQVYTPVLEYLDNFSAESNRCFKLLDRQGEILALRPEMTAPIARMVATRLADRRFPQRYAYVGNVFRAKGGPGERREFFQAGVELIGDESAVADAEIIEIASELLSSCGMRDYQISLSHVDFLRGIVMALEIPQSARERLLSAVIRQDFVETEILMAQYGIDGKSRETINALPSMRGGVELIDEAARQVNNSISLAALDNLREVLRLLQHYGMADNVYVDFSVMRDFDYYSGMVFEGYSPHVGVPLCGGGRYDGLLASYGLDRAATGFAVSLDGLLQALDAEPEACAVDFLVIGDDVLAAISKAQELRSKGFSAQICVNESAAEESIPTRNVIRL